MIVRKGLDAEEVLGLVWIAREGWMLDRFTANEMRCSLGERTASAKNRQLATDLKLSRVVQRSSAPWRGDCTTATKSRQPAVRLVCFSRWVSPTFSVFRFISERTQGTPTSLKKLKVTTKKSADPRRFSRQQPRKTQVSPSPGARHRIFCLASSKRTCCLQSEGTQELRYA